MLIYSKFSYRTLYIFLFPKFSELFFTPKNTPPKYKNSKLHKIPIFLEMKILKKNMTFFSSK